MVSQKHRRIRVVYLIDKLHRAGAQSHLFHLVTRVDSTQFEPRVVCLHRGGSFADEIRQRGITVDALGIARIYSVPAMLGLSRLARSLRDNRIDVLHTYLTSANIFGTVAARLAGVPVILTTRRDTGFDRNWRLKFVEERFINPQVTRVLAVCPSVTDLARRERGLDKDKVITIVNGVDLEQMSSRSHFRSAMRTSLGLEPSDVAVSVIGHLSPVKGHADLIHALARVLTEDRRPRLFVIGDGSLRSELDSLAKALGIRERIEFMGVRDDIPKLLAAMDISVISSHTEGMSNALLEAMAMSLPVIATAVGGNIDVIEDGVTGVLVPARNPKAMGDAILQLTRDQGARRALGKRARDCVEENYSLAKMVTRYERLYRELRTGRLDE